MRTPRILRVCTLIEAVNGAELNLLSLDNSMPYGDDEDRVQRRLHLLSTPVHAVLKSSMLGVVKASGHSAALDSSDATQ